MLSPSVCDFLGGSCESSEPRPFQVTWKSGDIRHRHDFLSYWTNTRIDYAKLVEQFGTKLIDDVLLERFERLTGQKPHRYLRRQIAFSHRDLEVILDR